MVHSQAIEKILPAFERYYTIKKDEVTTPFCAEAEFRSHNEQYFLVRSAHIADIDSNEFVYFATLNDLDNAKLEELVNAAWQAGLAKVHPHEGHRNSDVGVTLNWRQQTLLVWKPEPVLQFSPIARARILQS